MKNRFRSALALGGMLLLVTGCPGHKKNLMLATQQQQLGANKLTQGDAEGAVADLTSAHRLEPKNADITNLLGTAYWAKARVISDESLKLEAEKLMLESFKQVGEDKVSGDWRNNLGALYIDMKRWDDAVVQLQKAIKDPEYRTPERPLNNLCMASLEQKKFPEAADYCGRAIKIQPRFCMALLNHGKSNVGLKKYPDALEDFLAVQKECPDWPEPYLEAGKLLLLMKHPEQARPQFQKCIELDPNGPFGKEAQKFLKSL